MHIGRPVSHEERNLEMYAFPNHFPTGQFGMYHDGREIRINPATYIRNRMYNVDRRFAEDFNYMFHMANYQDMREINAGVVFQMKKATKQQGKKKMRPVKGMDVLNAINELETTDAKHQSNDPVWTILLAKF